MYGCQSNTFQYYHKTPTSLHVNLNPSRIVASHWSAMKWGSVTDDVIEYDAEKVKLLNVRMKISFFQQVIFLLLLQKSRKKKHFGGRWRASCPLYKKQFGVMEGALPLGPPDPGTLPPPLPSPACRSLISKDVQLLEIFSENVGNLAQPTSVMTVMDPLFWTT